LQPLNPNRCKAYLERIAFVALKRGLAAAAKGYKNFLEAANRIQMIGETSRREYPGFAAENYLSSVLKRRHAEFKSTIFIDGSNTIDPDFSTKV
jgi:hypothetical protein